jgi:ABC-type dipeptide/oligopeptide/nickel transport system ATPase component
MKYKSIELIGVSGSGKSFTEQELRKLTKNTFKIYNRREIIIRFSSKIINLNLKDRLTLLYFYLINLFGEKKINQLKIRKKSRVIRNYKFRLGNYFRKNYIILCIKIFNKYSIKNKKFKKEIDYLIKNLKYIEKNQVLFWFYELCAAQYIFDNTKKENYIFLNDEGFIPKSQLYLYTKLNFEKIKKKVFKYLKHIQYPDLCLYLKKDKEEIYKVHKKRKEYNVEMHLNKKLQIDSLKLYKYVIGLLRNKTQVIELKNNHRITKKIIKLIV